MSTTSSPTSDSLSTGSNQAAVAVWAGVAAILIALGFATTYLAEPDEDLFYDYSVAVSALIQFGILIAASMGIALWLGRPLPVLGLKGFAWRWVWVALGLILLVLGLAAALEGYLHAGEEQGLSPDTWRPDRAGAFALNALIAATLVPFTEEVFFRGLGVRALLPFGSATAVLVTATVFGLAHGLFVALPILIPFGIVLGWVRLRSDSVWPGVIAHGLYNGTALLFVYLDLTNRL
jgi:membrane protease YdiL (CAAX protease family)